MVVLFRSLKFPMVTQTLHYLPKSTPTTRYNHIILYYHVFVMVNCLLMFYNHLFYYLVCFIFKQILLRLHFFHVIQSTIYQLHRLQTELSKIASASVPKYRKYFHQQKYRKCLDLMHGNYDKILVFEYYPFDNISNPNS